MSKKAPIKIAIADDHSMVRDSISAMLSTFGGFEVIIEAKNGQELIDAILEKGFLPDVCIVDISMPAMDGYQTLVGLRKRWINIKVLVLSMYNNEYSVIKMLTAGANGYLTKDSNLDELNAALTSIYVKGYYNSELISSNVFHALQNKPTNQQFHISEKEMQFLKFCCTELSYKEIGQIMTVSSRTVEGYRNALFAKLNLNSRVGLVMFAIHTGLVPIDNINPLVG